MSKTLNSLTWEEEKRFFGFVIRKSKAQKENGIYKELKNDKIIKELESQLLDHKPFELGYFNNLIRGCNEKLLEQKRINVIKDEENDSKIYVSHPLKTMKLSLIDLAYYTAVDYSKTIL